MRELATIGDNAPIQFDQEAVVIGELYDRAGKSLIDSTRDYLECGERLVAKKATMAHGQWLPWLKANVEALGFENITSTPQRLMKVARANSASTLNLDDPATALAINRQLHHNTDSQLVQQSLSNEHYTPQQYLDAARHVLGGIDLDPASCVEANRIVGADMFYSAEDNGLHKSWSGRVWLNPPYGRNTGDFVAKFMDEYGARRIDCGIILVNAHCTDTDWFQPLWDGVLCFTDHRINFYGDDERSGSTHGSVFAYFGAEQTQFAQTFQAFGAIVRTYAP